MHPYQPFVREIARLMADAKQLPLGGFPAAQPAPIASDAPLVLIFSPHPDDECIIGGLALRLRRECGWRAVNVAVTQGSNRARQTARWLELQEACAFLGFELVPTRPGGLEGIHPKVRANDPIAWRESVRIIAEILSRHAPKLILFPHDTDWNSTHVGTHWLVRDALATLPDTFACGVVETEFWGAMATPNLMVESSAEDVADLVAATSFHVGEVRRNPYHLLLPAWLQDNVRRGGELVGGQGKGPPDYLFATLYRLSRWSGGQLRAVPPGGRMLGAKENPLEVLFT